MKLDGSRILITGAAGGIGRELALALARRGARLLLAGRDEAALAELGGEIQALGAQAAPIHADLADPDAADAIARAAARLAGGVDVLVNLAGITHFGLFQQQSASGLERLWRVNVIAPMNLARALLPGMLARRSGRIVNIGSVFGAIGFPCFASYSASKSALRGFSQALRRELHGSGVGVSYVAPRYTRTALNAGAVSRMAAALKMNQDSPERVAHHIVAAIERDRDETTIGLPEALFVRINALLPRVVDRALRQQNLRMRDFVAQPGEG
jgi:short-subunit dehydrogenase